jgi:hypothetical protein
MMMNDAFILYYVFLSFFILIVNLRDFKWKMKKSSIGFSSKSKNRRNILPAEHFARLMWLSSGLEFEIPGVNLIKLLGAYLGA